MKAVAKRYRERDRRCTLKVYIATKEKRFALYFSSDEGITFRTIEQFSRPSKLIGERSRVR